jgi:hypothetical protein
MRIRVCTAIVASDVIAGAFPTSAVASDSWVIYSSPNDQLLAVTCITSTDCFAVGSSAGQTLIEEDTGSAWTIVSSPNASSNDKLERQRNHRRIRLHSP